MKVILEFDDKSIRKMQTILGKGLHRFFDDPKAAAMLMKLANELDKATAKASTKKKKKRSKPSRKVAK